MLSAITLPSFAKINLQLRVVGKRKDGYHELFTVFQTVSLKDELIFSENDMIALTCNDSTIPTDNKNLIVRAAYDLKEKCGVRSGASIHLEKNIPSPGGLGGGSSNAAVTLLGLRRLWKLDVSDDSLFEVAAGLGSDVPYFLHGGTAIGTGRGELIEEIDDVTEQFLLIVTPDIAVSTTDAFARLDAPSLTKIESNRILRVCRLEANRLDLHQTKLIIDFEESVFDAHPEIRRVKETLLRLGAVGAAMSGSGASVFAIFDKTETRQAAIKALDHESTWRKFAVATISRDEYREALRC